MTATSSALIFSRDSKSIKKPLFLKDGGFLIYAPRKHKFPHAEFTKYDTEVTVTLPRDSQGFFGSKYKDEIEQFLSIIGRLWIGILNKLFFEDIVIGKGQVLGFFVLKTDKRFTVKNETKTMSLTTTRETLS